MVRKERLELSRRKTLEPKSSASTNFATSAQNPGKSDSPSTNEARDGVTECESFQRLRPETRDPSGRITRRACRVISLGNNPEFT